MRRSFFRTLFISYTSVVVVSAAAIGLLVSHHLRREAMRETQLSLFRTARLLAAMQAAQPARLWSEQLSREVTELAADTGLHLALLFANGSLAAESVPSQIVRTESVLTEELRGARQSAFGQTIRSLGPRGPLYMFVAAPIFLEYELIGYARVGLPMAQLEERQVALGRGVAAGASLSVLAAVGVGLVVARYVTRPLAAIEGACQRLATGQPHERIALARDDEFGIVAATIDRMAGEVQRRITAETRERLRLATLLEVMTDGVIAISARGTIAYVNAVAGRLFAMEVSAVNKPWSEAIVPPVVREAYTTARATGRHVKHEVHLPGHPHDQVLRLDATPLQDDTGGPFGVLLVFHDLSEIRRLENMRRTFAANVSHELKTPLTAIGAIVDTLLDDSPPPPDLQRRFCERIRDQNDRLTRLVRDLLVISRLESDKDVLELSSVDLVGIATECAQTFAEVAAAKGLTLTQLSSVESLRVVANPEAVRLILNNLIHNAVAYTHAGGEVRVQLTAADGWACLVVHDSGVGIAPEHLERIFERFYRVDSARAREAGGTGLGLSIVKHLSHALGGSVIVASEPGTGSIFTVRLPMVA